MTCSVLSSNFTKKVNKGQGFTVKPGSHSPSAHSEANEIREDKEGKGGEKREGKSVWVQKYKGVRTKKQIRKGGLNSVSAKE